MNPKTCLLLAILSPAAVPVSLAEEPAPPAAQKPVVLTDEARRIHESAIVIDGHNDLPWEVRKKGGSFQRFDIAASQPSVQTDIPRLRAGGVGAQFWSVWVPPETMYDESALISTLEQIETVKRMIRTYPDTFELALSADDIRRIHSEGKIASLIGVEGGHCIENSLRVLRVLYNLGARYMTLTHSLTIDWADSATDKHLHGGLTPFGEDVVREMNRLGMMVDLSHVSAETMRDALRVTTAPVIFSHSSARALAGHTRNVPDDVLKLIPQNGGIVMVNYYSGYIVPASAAIETEWNEYKHKLAREVDSKEERDRLLNAWEAEHPLPRGTIHAVIDHIDHIAKVAGIDHVGLGSDYDGVSTLPTQLEDVSSYPYITQALLDRSYSEEDIVKILGGNLLRVFQGVEEAAGAEESGN